MKSEEYIKSYVRIKPLQSQETSVISTTKREVAINKNNQYFTFTQVFNDECLNQEIFQRIILPIMPSFFDGYNACILAYGQTSSGKTYTMKGTHNNLGVIPLTIKQIFKYIKSSSLLAKISISYFEIYNENIIDLLSQQQTSKYLQVREDGKRNLFINNLIEQQVKDQYESFNFYDKGQLKRKFASNNINFQSSRSHTIFRIILSSVNSDNQLLESVISMVDLAGSESISKTNAVGALKKQAENINKSLLSLTSVIRAISEKQDYINYRNSKLTRILQPCLSGNTKTIVICNIKQVEQSIGQTLNTLKFGVSANNIKMIVRQNIKDRPSEDDNIKTKQLMQQLQLQKQEKKDLQQQLQNKTSEFYSLSERNKENLLQIQELKHQLFTFENERKHHDGMIYFLRQQQQRQKMTKSMFFEKSKEAIETLQIQIKNYKISVHNLNEIILKKNAKIAVLQKNQKFLLDKIQTYQKEMNMLQLSASNQDCGFQSKPAEIQKHSISVHKRQRQHSVYRQKHNQSNKLFTSPFTIGTVIKLSTTILTYKIDMNHYLNTISELHEQIEGLQRQIEAINAKIKDDNRQPNSSTRFSETASMKNKEQQRKTKNLQNKIVSLRKENQMLKRKNGKYIKYLKKCANNNIDTINGFNSYLQKNFKNDEKALFEQLMQQNADSYHPFKGYNYEKSTNYYPQNQQNVRLSQPNNYNRPQACLQRSRNQESGNFDIYDRQ